jgi:hypothetical protein
MTKNPPARPLAPAPLSERQAYVPDWLLKDWFVRGSVYVLGGRGKTMKSSLLLSMAATVTRGNAWPWLPEERAERGSVIWLGGEDAPDVTHLRMLANDVDETKFHLFGVNDFGHRLGEEVGKLDLLCYQLGDVRMLVVDPLKSFMSGVSEIAARQVIAPLQELAARHNLLCWLVVHTVKGPRRARRPIDLIADSAAFVNAARGTWLMTTHPAEKSVLVNLAHNVGPLIRSGVEFGSKIVTVESLRARFGNRIKVGPFPIGEVAIPAEFQVVDNVDIEGLVDIGDRGAGRFDERAREWCVSYLSRRQDGVPIEEIIADARAEGIYETRLRSALRSVAYHEGGHRGAPALWFLRRDPNTPPPLAN